MSTGPRAYHGCATVDMLIYLIGGFDGMDYFNSVRCFNPVSKEWSEVAPMNSRRLLSSLAMPRRLNRPIHQSVAFVAS